MVTLDTNVLIYYLDGVPEIAATVDTLLVEQPRPFIATVTELEAFSFRFLTEEEVIRIDRLIQSLSVILLDSYLARKAAELRRLYRMKTPDSIVAATALFTHSTLLTRNIKDFRKVSGLTVRRI
jgi:predicted nucleic acid-binding protein